MLESAKSGGDVYSAIAAIAFNTTYENCQEFFPEGTPIRHNEKHEWEICDKSICEKLADGKTDTNYPGKNRRAQAKNIVLGITYGRGINSIAQQLNTTKEDAQRIYDSVIATFKGLKRLKDESEESARTKGFVTTLWGRKRRLPEINLPKFEIEYTNAFATKTGIKEVPDDIKQIYLNKLSKCKWRDDIKKIKDSAREDGIYIKDNSAEIAKAQRQCVNSRVQGKPNRLTALIY